LVNGALLGPALIQLTTVFPLPRPLPRGVIAATYGAALALLIAAMLAPLAAGRTLVALLVALAAILIGSAAVRIAFAGRESPAARLVLLTTLVAEIPLLLRPLCLALGWLPPPYELALVAQLCLPLGLATAVLRYDLFAINAALRRALVYAAVSLVLLTLYFGLTAALAGVLSNALPELRGFAASIGLLMSAVAFAPLRTRAQRLVDRLLYPERLRFAPALAAAQERLAHVIDQLTATILIAEELPTQIGAAWGHLGLAPAPDVADHPDAKRAWTTRLVVGTQVLGRIWIGPRRSGLPYDAEERAQFESLARQLALALANAELVETLRDINRNLEAQVAERTTELLARERSLAVLAERQRVARELHDSVTQALFSLSLGARALRRQAQRGTVDLAADLGEQEATAQQALGEMRALLHQLRAPMAPDDAAPQADLVAAIRGVCEAALQRHELTVTLVAPPERSVPAALASELAAIAREALQNVAHHSGAQAAEIQLLPTGAALTMIITDAGRGFVPADVGAARLGLRGMSERAVALGGALTITSVPGRGTTLAVRVPYNSSG
jgi:signal transduction histidine kinase